MANREIVGSRTWNGGRDISDIVREADPDGSAAEHVIIKTQRVVDGLRQRGAISPDQYHAASWLRENWERAGLLTGRLRAASLEQRSRGEPELISDAEAWGAYNEAMKACGEWRLALRCIVIDDWTLEDFGRKFRCAALTTLVISLDRLWRHGESIGWGKRPRRRNKRTSVGIVATQGKLTADERSARARRAINARWAKKNA